MPGKQFQALNDSATYPSLQFWFVFSLWQQEHSKAIYGLGTSTGTNYSQEAICIQSLLLWRQRELSSMDTNQSLLHSPCAISVSGCIRFVSGCPAPEGFMVRLDGVLSKLTKWKVSLLLAVGLELDRLESPFQPFYDSVILHIGMEYMCQMREMYF